MYTVHCTQYSKCTLYNVHCTPNTIPNIVFGVKKRLRNNLKNIDARNESRACSSNINCNYYIVGAVLKKGRGRKGV